MEIRMKHSTLLHIIFLSLFLFSGNHLYTAETYPAARSAAAAPRFFIQRYPEEGFAAGTLVRIPDGYNLSKLLPNTI